MDDFKLETTKDVVMFAINYNANRLKLRRKLDLVNIWKTSYINQYGKDCGHMRFCRNKCFYVVSGNYYPTQMIRDFEKFEVDTTFRRRIIMAKTKIPLFHM